MNNIQKKGISLLISLTVGIIFIGLAGVDWKILLGIIFIFNANLLFQQIIVEKDSIFN